MKKMYFFILGFFATLTLGAQTLVYSNDFSSGSGTASIFGNGVVEPASIGGFGNIYHNAAGGQGIRSNYLLLPDNVLASSAVSKELTISFFVNVGTATDYYWTPIFTAYGAAPIAGANTWPMLALQSRLVAQVNCAGWTDLVDAENANAINKVSTLWLDDANWHFYAATFSETKVIIYVDGVVQNEWNVSTTAGNTVNGLFSNGADLKYICLGGNQAWNWGDPDPAYLFDDVAIYSSVLTPNQMTQIMNTKSLSSGYSINTNSPELRDEVFYTLTGSRVDSKFNQLRKGMYIKKSVFSDGTVQSTKISKSIDF